MSDSGQVLREIGALQAEMRGANSKLDDLDRRIRSLEEVASMGRGALWTLLKVGALLSVVAGGVAWVLGWFR